MAPMIELHNVNVPDFMEVLEACDGNVFLVSRDGDHLNLKSRLCQLLGLTKLIEGGKIAEAYIVCEKPEDENRLTRLNRYGKLSGLL